MTIPDLTTHPDPQWWMRLPESTSIDLLDCCSYCGHVRNWHDMAGCRCNSLDLIHKGRCDCTNTRNGSIYRDPRAGHPARR